MQSLAEATRTLGELANASRQAGEGLRDLLPGPLTKAIRFPDEARTASSFPID
jgi:hypothetical protein